MASDMHSESDDGEPVPARTKESESVTETAGAVTAEAFESAGDGVAGDSDAAGVTAAAGPTVAEPRRGLSRVVVLGCVAAAALLIDVVSKMLIVAKLSDHAPVRLPSGILTLNLIRNSGAAFSIGQGQTWVFTIIAAIVVVVIVRISRNLRSAPWACALGLLLGGALGNLGDRIFREPKLFEGHVVDFLQFPTLPLIHRDFPVFNLADSAIVAGGCLMVLLSFLGIQPDGTRHVAAGAESDDDDGSAASVETETETEAEAEVDTTAEAGTRAATEADTGADIGAETAETAQR